MLLSTFGSILLLSGVVGSLTTVEWPFYSGKDGIMYLSTLLGTPDQYIDVSLYYMHTDQDLRVKAKSLGGKYDASNSTSFKQTGVVNSDNGSPIGLQAWEQFLLGVTNVTISGPAPFQWINDSHIPFEADIGLNWPPDGGFLQSVMSELPDHTMTLAFDTYPTSGALTLGGRDKTRCLNDWRVVSKKVVSVGEYYYFGMQIDDLTAGKYSYQDAGVAVFTVNEAPPVRWPKTVYYSLVNALGSKDGITVPCNTTTNITLKVEDITIVITPEEYLDHSTEETEGACLLIGETVDKVDVYVLPQAVFKKHCLMVNHEKYEIGVATRKQ